MASMAFKKIQWSPNTNLPSRHSHLPRRTQEDFEPREIAFPSPYIIPNLQYVNRSTPPFSTEEQPFVCPATDLLKLDHLHNPMIVFGQPFSGKTCLFMKLTTLADSLYGPKHWIRMIDLRLAVLACNASGNWPTDIFQFLSDSLKMSEDALYKLFKPLPNAKELIRKKKFDKLIKGELFLDGFDEISVADREYFLKLLPQLKRNRQECPIRVWISCRNYFKHRVIREMGDESSFDILDYDVEQQKRLLFCRWKDKLFPKKIQKHEEDRLWEYTHIMYDEFCKEIKGFGMTLGTSPLYLTVISSVFNNHASNFLTLYRKVRQDERAGPSGLGLANPTNNSTGSSTKNSSETPTGKGKKKKKKSAQNKEPNKASTSAEEDNGDGASAPTSQLMCQIAGIFTAELFEYMVFTVIDLYCLKYIFKTGTEEEYRIMLDREYRRAMHLYAQYSIKTFPRFEYETLIPNPEDPSQLVQNLNYIVDEELLHIGLMVMEEKTGLVHLREKLIGDFFLAAHYAFEENMDKGEELFDHFFLRTLLFDGEAKHTRSFFDNILHFVVGDYRPKMLHDFLIEQYKLGPDEDDAWEQIRNGSSVWHLAVMEGFHRTAMVMINCFNPATEREHVRKLLRIKAPMEVFEGTRNLKTVCRVDGGGYNQRHLVSSISLLGLFAYSVGMEELLKTMARFFTPEELREEFITPETWTPMHYAAMHSNLWFFMYMYNNVLLPAKIQPPPGMFNPQGQLPTHTLMSYSWIHIMVLRDHFCPGFDKLLKGCSSPSCSMPPTSEATEAGNCRRITHMIGNALCGGHDNCCEQDERECNYYREIICYREMIKEVTGPGNLLRLTHHECIRLMVQFGGENINASDKITQNTMLHCAAMEGYLETVKYLLDHGANLEPKNREGRTPLHYAGLNGHRQVFLCLVKKGSKPTLQDFGGLTPTTLWTMYGDRIDKAHNGPMTNEEMHLFKACIDIDKLLQEKSAQIKEEEEAAKKNEIDNEVDEGEDTAPVTPVHDDEFADPAEEDTQNTVEPVDNDDKELLVEDTNGNGVEDEEADDDISDEAGDSDKDDGSDCDDDEDEL